MFTSRKAVIAQLESDPATYSAAEADKVRKALLKRKRKVRSSWVPLRRRAQRRKKPQPSAAEKTQGSYLETEGGLTVMGKEVADNPTVMGKEVAHDPTVMGKEVADDPTVMGKEVAEVPTDMGKEVAEIPTGMGKEVAEIPTVMGKEVADGPTVMGKEVAEGPTVTGKEVAEGPTSMDCDTAEAQPAVAEADASPSEYSDEAKISSTSVTEDNSTGLVEDGALVFSVGDPHRLSANPWVEKEHEDVVMRDVEDPFGQCNNGPGSGSLVPTAVAAQNAVLPNGLLPATVGLGDKDSPVMTDKVIVEPVDDLFLQTDDDDEEGDHKMTSLSFSRTKWSGVFKFVSHTDAVVDEMVPELGPT